MISQPKRRISVQKRESQSLFFRIVYFFLLFSFAGVTIHILIFSSFLRVNYLNLMGTEKLGYENVYGKLSSLLNGKYLWVFPKDNFLLVFKGKIEKEILNEFKRIRSVEVEKVFPDTVNVKIEERESLLLWCSGGPCYIIDERGLAYSWADFESKEIKENNLARLIDTSAKSINVGEKILEEDYVQFVIGIKNDLEKELGIEVLDEYNTPTRLAGIIKVTTSEGWALHLNTQNPLDQSIRTLKTFLEQKINDEIRKELEYVDLRVENKIYYKLKSVEDSDNLSVDEADSKDGDKNKEEDKSDN